MARMRSPSYPSISLKQAIDLVSKIHRDVRTNVVSRETAAEAMGYSGLTGRSLKLLSALLQFDLLVKAGKGDVRVTQTAVEILHGITEDERRAAMLRAGESPSLFKDIYERFPQGIPSEGAIRSFLIQQEFADVAIGPAIKAFMETYRDLEFIRESESHGDSAQDAAESLAIEEQEIPVKDKQPPTPPAFTPPSGMLADEALNKINMNIQGDRVVLSGMLDIKGLRLLEKKIAGLKTLLAVDEDDEDGPDYENLDPRD